MDSEPQDTGQEPHPLCSGPDTIWIFPWKPTITALCKLPLDIGTTRTGLCYHGEPEAEMSTYRSKQCPQG